MIYLPLSDQVLAQQISDDVLCGDLTTETLGTPIGLMRRAISAIGGIVPTTL
jgi:hypothetical protein